jgi:hypothetical protein
MDPGTLPAVKVPSAEIIPDGLLRERQLIGNLPDAAVWQLIFDLPQLRKSNCSCHDLSWIDLSKYTHNLLKNEIKKPL